MAMRFMLAFTLTLLWVASGLAADKRPANEGKARDLAALQGRWQAWIATDDVLEIEVTGDAFVVVRHSAAGATLPIAGSLVLNPHASPKQLDWVNVKIDGQDAPNNLCIYELAGDTWLMIGGGSETRPAQFFSGGGIGNKTWVLKRQKDKP